jgi:hypothetical protein
MNFYCGHAKRACEAGEAHLWCASERDSSGTTEATRRAPLVRRGAKVMERIARREPPKVAKRLAQRY